MTFTLTPSEAATRVEVTESGYEVTVDGAAMAVQQTNSWAEFLNFLKARLQFGVELRAGREH